MFGQWVYGSMSLRVDKFMGRRVHVFFSSLSRSNDVSSSREKYLSELFCLRNRVSRIFARWAAWPEVLQKLTKNDQKLTENEAWCNTFHLEPYVQLIKSKQDLTQKVLKCCPYVEKFSTFFSSNLVTLALINCFNACDSKAKNCYQSHLILSHDWKSWTIHS
jgi:hypothetical protein